MPFTEADMSFLNSATASPPPLIDFFSISSSPQNPPQTPPPPPCSPPYYSSLSPPKHFPSLLPSASSYYYMPSHLPNSRSLTSMSFIENSLVTPCPPPLISTLCEPQQEQTQQQLQQQQQQQQSAQQPPRQSQQDNSNDDDCDDDDDEACLPSPSETLKTCAPPSFGKGGIFRVWKLPKHVFAQYLCAFGLELKYPDGTPVMLVDLERPSTTPTQSTELVYHLIYEISPLHRNCTIRACKLPDDRSACLQRLTFRITTETEDGKPGLVPLCYSRFNSRQYYQEPSNKRFKFNGDHAEWSIKLRFAHRTPIRLKATIDELPDLVAHSEPFVIKGRVPTRVMHEMQMNDAATAQQTLWEAVPAEKQSALHSVRERAWELAQSPRVVRANGLRARGKMLPPPLLDPNDSVYDPVVSSSEITSFGAMKASQVLSSSSSALVRSPSPFPMLAHSAPLASPSSPLSSPCIRPSSPSPSSSTASPSPFSSSVTASSSAADPLHVTVPLIEPRACVNVGETVQISASGFGGSPPYRFSWSAGSTAGDYLSRFFGLNSPTLEIRSALQSDTGPYCLTVVDATGRSVSSVEVALIVKDLPSQQAPPIALEPNTVILPIPPYGHRIYINHIPVAVVSKIVSVRLESYPRDLIFWCSNNGTSFFDAPQLAAGSYAVHLVFNDSRQQPLPCGELHYIDDACPNDTGLFSFILSGTGFPSTNASNPSSSAHPSGHYSSNGSYQASDDATLNSFFSFDNAQLHTTSRSALAEHIQPLLLRLLSGNSDPFEAIRRTVFKLGVNFDNLLMDNMLDRTALHVAAQFGHVKTVAFLLQQTAINIDQQDVMGNTALHLAASEGHVSMLEELIRYGADMSLPNSRGETALMIAQREQFFEAAELLFIVLLRECTANDGLDSQLLSSQGFDDDGAENEEEELSDDTFDDLQCELSESTQLLVNSLQDSTISIPYRSVALCIGINKYADDSLSNLQGATADAAAMSAVLGASGFDENILLLESQATRLNILEALSNALRPPYTAQIRLVIFFAGHSVASTATWALVPYEGNPLTMQELIASLAHVPIVHALFMIDSCFCVDIYSSRNAPFAELASRATSPAPLCSHSGAAPHSFLHQPVWEVLAASSDNERASETTNGRSYGIFTYYLLQALSGDAFPHHRNWLTCDELHKWVLEKVSSKTRGRQSPDLFSLLPPSSSNAHFIFTRPHRRYPTEPLLPRSPATCRVSFLWDALPLKLFHSGHPQLSICPSSGVFLALDEGLVFNGRELEIFLSGLTPLDASMLSSSSTGDSRFALRCIVSVEGQTGTFPLSFSRAKNVFESNVTLPIDPRSFGGQVFPITIDIQLSRGGSSEAVSLMQTPWILPCVAIKRSESSSKQLSTHSSAVSRLMWYSLTTGNVTECSATPPWTRVQTYIRQQFTVKWDHSLTSQLWPFFDRLFELSDDQPVSAEQFLQIWQWFDLLSTLEPIHEFLLLITAADAEQSLEELRKPAMILRVSETAPAIVASWLSSSNEPISHSTEGFSSLMQLRSFLARSTKLPVLTSRQLVDPQQVLLRLSEALGPSEHSRPPRPASSSSSSSLRSSSSPSFSIASPSSSSSSPPLLHLSPQFDQHFASDDLALTDPASPLALSTSPPSVLITAVDGAQRRSAGDFEPLMAAPPSPEVHSPFPEQGDVITVGELSIRLQSVLDPAVQSPSTVWYEGKSRLPGSQCEQTFIVKAIRHSSPALPEEVVMHMTLAHRGIVSLLAHELSIGQQQISFLALNTTGGIPLSSALKSPLPTVVKWARQLALAISYLHSREPSVCLGHLSSSTVQIINGSLQIFDLSAAYFTDIEAASSNNEVNADLALFGNLLFELLTGERCTPWSRTRADVDSSDRLLSTLFNLIKQCWNGSLDLNKVVRILDQASSECSLSLYECVERNLVQPAIELAMRNPLSIQPASPAHSMPGSMIVGDTPLHLSIRLGLQQMTLELLKIYLKHNTNVDTGLLRIAAGCGHAGIVASFLMEADFRKNVNSCDPTTGRTALHLAAMHDHLGSASLLIQAGASVFSTDYNNKTPVHLALEFSASYKLIASMIDACSTPVEFATLVRTPSSRMLVTPLHSAILMGRTDVVQLLLEGKQTTAEIRKLMLNARDATGRSLISIAASAGQKAIFSLLANYPSVLTQQDDNRRNVIHICALAGNLEILSLVLGEPSSKQLLNQADSNGSTPLHLAARWGYGRIVKMLLVQNALPNHLDRNGDTPLDLATRHGHTAVVQHLQRYTAIVVLESQPIEEEIEEEKKNSFNNSLPGASCYEQAPAMLPDTASNHCFSCQKTFTLFRRRHHCRACGLLFCLGCSSTFIPLPQFGHRDPVRVCDHCESNNKQHKDHAFSATSYAAPHLNFVI